MTRARLGAGIADARRSTGGCSSDADESYEEWGYSGSLVYEPGADRPLAMRVERAGAGPDAARRRVGRRRAGPNLWTRWRTRTASCAGVRRVGKGGLAPGALLEGAGQIQGLGRRRYDGGDAETGQGFEVGGGLDWARGSLTLQVNGRMLVAHADESYEEWGYSGSLVYEPGADGLGLQMRVGSSAGGGERHPEPVGAGVSGLVRGGAVPFAQRFDAEVGYGSGAERSGIPTSSPTIPAKRGTA